MNEVLTTADLEILYEELPQHIYACAGQLSFYDRLIYYWAGKTYFSGRGMIVDAGALLGGTAILLAHGISKNRPDLRARARIMSYDLFEDREDGFMSKAIRTLAGTRAPSAVEGIVDWEPLFHENTADYADMIEVHRGNIEKHGYTSSHPIEILSIDVGKSPRLMRSVALDFFPHLLPSHGIVLNQDYIFPFQPWVHIAMELVADCLTLEYAPPAECTVIHRCTRLISRSELESRIPEDYFTIENVRLIQGAADRATSPSNRVALRMAQIHAYWLLGYHRTAQAVVHQMVDEHNLTSAHVQRSASLKRLCDQVNVRISET